ncbi:hypothetical protein FOZ62_013452, partial [Perkinsus olseni]
ACLDITGPVRVDTSRSFRDSQERNATTVLLHARRRFHAIAMEKLVADESYGQSPSHSQLFLILVMLPKSLSTMMLSSIVTALKTTTTLREAATIQRRIDARKPDPWSHLCTINYLNTEKPHDLFIGSSTDPRATSSDEFFWLTARVPDGEGGKLRVSY